MPAIPSEETWSTHFVRLLESHTIADAAHDLQHIRRVVTNARRLALAEGADWQIVMPAAWLHDCVIVPKSSPDRKRASQLAARQALAWLEELEWPFGKLEEIAHAIEAHSFSAGIEPRTPEAKVLQDADRLDALGAVGLARTLMLGAEMKREFYQPEDPFCRSRPCGRLGLHAGSPLLQTPHAGRHHANGQRPIRSPRAHPFPPAVPGSTRCGNLLIRILDLRPQAAVAMEGVRRPAIPSIFQPLK